MKNHLKGIKVSAKTLFIIATLFFGIVIVGAPILESYADVINAEFGFTTQEIVTNDDEYVDDYYYKSAFTSVAGVRANGKAYNEAIVAEGATLVKNETVADGKPALPLAQNAKVSLFSTSSVSIFTTGVGSSYSDPGVGKTEEEDIDLKVGLEDAELKVNEDLWKWYQKNFSTYGRKSPGGASVGAYNSISDARWDQIGTDAKNATADAAIFVLSRSGGEGRDLSQWFGNTQAQNAGASGSDMRNGNYLELSDTERDVLTNLNRLKQEGIIRSIVVLMNSANQVQCDFVDDPTYGVDAMLWIGTTGSTGAYAVGRILAGKVNPSGRLADTFWKYHYKNPVNANYGMNAYTGNVGFTVGNTSSSAFSGGDPGSSSARHVVYQEGIYVGYRYAETRYEDVVMGSGNAGNFNYYDAISYPFGYGLSYTTFEYSDFKMEYTEKNPVNGLEDNRYTFTVTVTNTGKVAGKEVVQIYLQKPYTAYDIANGVEKAAVELVGFEKTDLLQPNGTQTLTITVEERSLASYDTNGAGTYIMDSGEYYFTLGRDAHDAVNNILKKKNSSYTTTAQGITGLGNTDLVVSVNKSFEGGIDATTYATSNKAQKAGIASEIVAIENQFETVDINYYAGAAQFADGSTFYYLSRSNWTRTLGNEKFGADENGNRTTTNRVVVTATDQMKRDRTASLTEPQPDDGAYPAYGVNNSPNAQGHLNLIDLRAYADDDDDPTNDKWIPYDDPLWDQLLDQLTWDETVSLLWSGVRRTGNVDSIAKPTTIDHNGSCGPVQPYGSGTNNRGLAQVYGDPDMGMTPCTYPCNGLAASTFNKTLLEYYGKQWGEDCLWAGYSGLYGMGINTHRSAYGGRNFEYYSEDPYLMGVAAACVTRGMATRGVYVYLKHCGLNDQDTYRYGGYTWANEQSIREVYMKSFQIAIEDGGATCVMTALNCIGVDWAGQHGFLNSVLRREFGMTGHAVSDAWMGIEGNYMRGILAGNDLCDGSYSSVDDSTILDCVTDGWTIKQFFADAAPVSEGGTGRYGDFAMQMRECVHRILYTTVHSNSMNGISSNTSVRYITPPWVHAVNAVKIVASIFFALSVAYLVVAIAWQPLTAWFKKMSERRAQQ